MKDLLAYKNAEVPVYDFEQNRAVPGEFDIVVAKPIVILEGIMAFHESRFRHLMDLKVFMLADDELRLKRRIERDVEKRGRSVESILAQYNRFVKPSHEGYVEP